MWRIGAVKVCSRVSLGANAIGAGNRGVKGSFRIVQFGWFYSKVGILLCGLSNP